MQMVANEKKIRKWAEAWIEYWTDFGKFAKFLSGEHPYNDSSNKETISRYQTVLDALDGKLTMPPEKVWLKRF